MTIHHRVFHEVVHTYIDDIDVLYSFAEFLDNFEENKAQELVSIDFICNGKMIFLLPLFYNSYVNGSPKHFKCVYYGECVSMVENLYYFS